MYTRIDMLSAVVGPEQERMLQLLDEVWVEDGSAIEPVDAEHAYCFVLIDGFVRATDERMGTWLVAPGQLFGLEELLVGVAPGREYRALTRCTLLNLTRDSLAKLVGAGDSFSQRIQVELSSLAGQAAQRRIVLLAKNL
jgi:hypothetical protein